MAIEHERDAIHNKPISSLVDDWRETVNLQQKHSRPFSLFWLAGPDQKMQQAVSYIAKKLDIKKGATLTQAIDMAHFDLTSELVALVEVVRLIPASRVLLIVNGFEALLESVDEEYHLTRAGHDWDQNVLENAPRMPWGQPYVEMQKHIAVVTTIGLLSGVEAYEKAVRSAIISQFRDGIIEIKR